MTDLQLAIACLTWAAVITIAIYSAYGRIEPIKAGNRPDLAGRSRQVTAGWEGRINGSISRSNQDL